MSTCELVLHGERYLTFLKFRHMKVKGEDRKPRTITF